MKKNNIDNIDFKEQIASFDTLGEFIDEDGYFKDVSGVPAKEHFEWWSRLAKDIEFLKSEGVIDMIYLSDDMEDYITWADKIRDNPNVKEEIIKEYEKEINY